ncbi:MAG TPA: hypothetical protein VG651_00860 [Stellaceae bacterium]|nr:hypothetical protein [Stellaceae bacterium]
MNRIRRVVVLAALAGAVILPRPSLALTQQGQQMMRNWVQSDRCAAQVRKQFPDYTPDALAKRDQALQRCLTDSILPPRAPLAPGHQ